MDTHPHVDPHPALCRYLVVGDLPDGGEAADEVDFDALPAAARDALTADRALRHVEVASVGGAHLRVERLAL